MWCARDASEYEIRLHTHSAGMLVFAPSLVVQRMRVIKDEERPESAVDTREICQACPALLKIIMLIIA